MTASLGRSTWKGHLRVSLVSIPVKAYTAATSGGGEIHLNQLHRDCHHRIRYQKTCPVHGEVCSEEIVSGYEYARGQSVVVQPEEMDRLRTESDRAIAIDAFVASESVDAVYHAGKSYYLLPDGPAGAKPYCLLHRAMVDAGRHAVARMVLSGRERLVLVRPLGRLLVMSSLVYQAQVKEAHVFEEAVAETELSAEEIRLATTLVAATSREVFELGRYQDLYTERLGALVEAKIQGHEIATAPAEPELQVINLMEALRRSVAEVRAAAPENRKKSLASGRTRKNPGQQKKRA
jgi:DNA end-binding protein Ku